MKVYLAIADGSEVMKTFITPEVKALLEESFQVVYLPVGQEPTVNNFKKYAKDCDAVITGWGHPVINSELLSGTKIKLIAHTGGTVGSLVAPDVYDAGVKVISGNLLFAESVAEGVISYMLLGLRRHYDSIKAVREGGFEPRGYSTRGLLGETVGIIGFGTISRFLIEMLGAFRVKIMLYSSHTLDAEYCEKHNITPASINEIFSKCKIVSLHSAMSERTRGMIGKEQFDLLCDGALFINTSRGRIVKEEEMTEALMSGRFDAVLDVYYNEPLEKDSPLRALPNVYPLPHLAGPTHDRRPHIARAVIEGAIKILAGGESELEISKAAASRMTVGG